jgi:hypothetical protein
MVWQFGLAVVNLVVGHGHKTSRNNWNRNNDNNNNGFRVVVASHKFLMVVRSSQ